MQNSMNDYYKQHVEGIAYFKAEARKAFADICKKYGLYERNPRLRTFYNHFQITFSNRKVRIYIEGINWGMNTDVYIGENRKDKCLYSLWHLIEIRPPVTPVTGSQIDQLYGYAAYLKKYASDGLSGDQQFFDELTEKLKRDEEAKKQAKQRVIDEKLATGYILIKSPFGESVLRKPRLHLPDYSVIKAQFPQAVDVFSDETIGDLIKGQDNQAIGIVRIWHKDLHELVQSNELICEFETDKVTVDVLAPITGTLLWLIPEGTVIKFDDAIALILPS